MIKGSCVITSGIGMFQICVKRFKQNHILKLKANTMIWSTLLFNAIETNIPSIIVFPNKRFYEEVICLEGGGALYKMYTSLRVRKVQGSIPDRGRVIPKMLKKWYQWFPCLALNIKRETLALSKLSKLPNSKNTIFEGLMED